MAVAASRHRQGQRSTHSFHWKGGAFAAYEDGFSLLELTCNHYQQAGLDVRQLDLLIR